MKCHLCVLEHEPGSCYARPIRGGYLYVSPEDVQKRNPKPVAATPAPVPTPEPTFESLFVEPEPVVEIAEEPAPEIGQLIWSDAPEGFEKGIVIVVIARRGYMLIRSDRNERLLAHFKDIVAPGAHQCVFKENSQVVFRRYFDPEKQREVAADVNLNEYIAPLAEIETSAIVKQLETYAIARRECGCEIMVPGACFGDSQIPQIGALIRHRRIETGGKVRATEVEVLCYVAA